MERIIIKAEVLAGIAEAARLWFKQKNEIYHAFMLEEKQAKRLRDELWKVKWDEDANLFIDEMPF